MVPVSCWTSRSLGVDLHAVDIGSGVAAINYTLAGAQNATAAAATDSVSFSVNKLGRSTLTFAATDTPGNVEPRQTRLLFVGPGVSCVASGPLPVMLSTHGALTLTGTTTVFGVTRPFTTTLTF